MALWNARPFADRFDLDPTDLVERFPGVLALCETARQGNVHHRPHSRRHHRSRCLGDATGAPLWALFVFFATGLAAVFGVVQLSRKRPGG